MKYPKGVVDLHLGVFGAAFEDIWPVILAIEFHHESGLVSLKVFDPSVKSGHQWNVSLVELRRLLR